MFRQVLIYHQAIYEPDPLKDLGNNEVNLQHEKSKSLAIAFRLWLECVCVCWEGGGAGGGDF